MNAVSEPGTGKIKVLIVDDEPPARRKIRAFLAEDPQVTIVGEAGNGTQALDCIRDTAPDVVFLDIQMPELDGFGVLQALVSDTRPEIVFVTAHDEYALRAFEVAAIDYLLKPFDSQRFSEALLRAKKQAQARQQAQNAIDLESRLSHLLHEVRSRTPVARRILVKGRDRSLMIHVDDIQWIQAAGNYADLHTGTGTHLIRDSLDGLLERLDCSVFLRVHRSFVVNVEHIAAMQPLSHGDQLIHMNDGSEIRFSRRYRDQLPPSILGGL